MSESNAIFTYLKLHSALLAFHLLCPSSSAFDHTFLTSWSRSAAALTPGDKGERRRKYLAFSRHFQKHAQKCGLHTRTHIRSVSPEEHLLDIKCSIKGRLLRGLHEHPDVCSFDMVQHYFGEWHILLPVCLQASVLHNPKIKSVVLAFWIIKWRQMMCQKLLRTSSVTGAPQSQNCA